MPEEKTVSNEQRLKNLQSSKMQVQSDIYESTETLKAVEQNIYMLTQIISSELPKPTGGEEK